MALRSLGRVKNTEYLDRSLQLILTDAVPAQDVFYLVGSVAMNPVGRWHMWEFLKTNSGYLFARYGSEFQQL